MARTQIDPTLLATVPTSKIQGTTTNNNAAAGFIGEYVAASVTVQNAAATNQYGDLTSISLTAGDWDVRLSAYWEQNGSTWSGAVIGVSTTSGNSGAGLTDGSTKFNDNFANSSTTPTLLMQSFTWRFSLAATTTIYFKYLATYTAGTPRAAGTLAARRMR